MAAVLRTTVDSMEFHSTFGKDRDARKKSIFRKREPDHCPAYFLVLTILLYSAQHAP